MDEYELSIISVRNARDQGFKVMAVSPPDEIVSPTDAVVSHNDVIVSLPVIAQNSHYQCGACRYPLKFERGTKEQYGFAIGWCVAEGCSSRLLKIRVPMVILTCEIVGKADEYE